MKDFKYLMIGGGMTADAAVKGIRSIDEKGAIGVISAEPDPPYYRPPLSKDLWKEGASLNDIWCATERKGADVLLGCKATKLDASKQEVTLADGAIIRYEKLLLATGGSPRHLPVGGDDVIHYRTCEDYRRLRSLCNEAHHIAIIGGGFIGAEMAAALCMNDKKVTMVFPEAALCGLLLPTPFAKALNHYYQEKGVTLVTGRKPSDIHRDQDDIVVHLENGHMFSVDGVVAGIGLVPNTQLAEDAGLDVDNGIVVDAQLRTKDPHIFAAGDVANFYSPILERRMRVEHEDNALTMGEAAGRNMAGAAQAYDHLPYFYSDLFDVGYEAVGVTDASLDVFTDLNTPQDKGCIFYLEQGRVRGVVFWNLFDQVAAGRELMTGPGPYREDDLRAWMKERLNA